VTNTRLSDDKKKRGGVVAVVRHTYHDIGATAQCVTNECLSDDKEDRGGVVDTRESVTNKRVSDDMPKSGCGWFSSTNTL